MVSALGFASLEDLIDSIIPDCLKKEISLDIPQPLQEMEAIETATAMGRRNKVFRSLIGMGYYDCIVPPVIQRNILENPGWYTQYTPYQAEISQGRLEALLNFQTMIADLTGLGISNASLLDEGTAAAEGMNICKSACKKKKADTFYVSDSCHPQTIDIVRARALNSGIKVISADPSTVTFDENCFGILLQYPATDGLIEDYSSLCAAAHEAGAFVVAATDLMALTMLTPPGEWGADIAVGTSQRFGTSLGFGGPHAAFMSVRDELKRTIPGRIVGVSKDASGKPAYRLALQAREQHIRRDKATSNICTAQVLLAIMASMYAVYHGPEGIRSIAEEIHSLAADLANNLSNNGINVRNKTFFDTLRVDVPDTKKVINRALSEGFNLRIYPDNSLGVSLDERSTPGEISKLSLIFTGGKDEASIPKTAADVIGIPEKLRRVSSYLAHPVFNSYRSETELLRYIYRLQNRDLSLTKSMIPLGSCTMKLNATAEMVPISQPEWARMHPFAPLDQAEGYLEMISQVESMLAEIIGLPATSLQPNSGAQGEYTGLSTIRNYHRARGEDNRNICLIPTSAHGTNPASASMAGMTVVTVKCDELGNINLEDLGGKAEKYRENLAALMITYPSTHGVFEESVCEIINIIHKNGGQVYLDGANLNALVGICKPGIFGADVCHLNLHKTFAMPHGGGGPGIGPIVAAKHLAPYLPGHFHHPDSSLTGGAVNSAPWGSAGILPIAWSYLRLMGPSGLTMASKTAILNANYVAFRLKEFFPILYTGKGGKVAHECILDCRGIRKTSGITVSDIAKRLMDYGFHAPTVSFPVADTLMVEPTESESREELDRFCDAMISIREEIEEVVSGQADHENNVLKNAPHTAEMVTSDEWDYPYTRTKAAYPREWIRESKFWPACRRIDDTWGDRHLFCSCVMPGDFSEE